MSVRPTPPPVAAHQHVRVYDQLRNAHLERAHELSPASIIFGSRRYDFDPSLTSGLDLIPAGPVQAAFVLARSRVRVLEINEPAMPHGLPRTAAAVAVVRLSALVRREPAQVVTYAIGNLDEWAAPRARWRSRARRSVEVAVSKWVAGQADRVVYGTAAARDLYGEMYGARLARAASTLIPALPHACSCPAVPRDADEVVFVGALQPRKGVAELLAAWPLVVAQRPSARLTVIGKGELEDSVRALASTTPGVTLVVDPPRAEIHAALRRAAVLVLLSQRTPTWREQVGLPLVEGLAHGCSVVTTTETGLAPWLAEHGHHVLPPDADPSIVAGAVTEALERRRTPADVLADLPAVDGRLAADAWLFGAAR